MSAVGRSLVEIEFQVISLHDIRCNYIIEDTRTMDKVLASFHTSTPNDFLFLLVSALLGIINLANCFVVSVYTCVRDYNVYTRPTRILQCLDYVDMVNA